MKNLQIKWNVSGKDIVVLHQFPRARFCPNASPFPIKLETFLRLHGIKYVLDYEEPMSEKHKCPWITINGENIADSQIALEYLAEKFDIDVHKGLKEEEKIISRALRFMIEQDLYWVLAQDRWVISKGEGMTDYMAPLMPMLPRSWEELIMMNWFFSGFVAKQTYAQGMGRHSPQEIQEMGLKDIEDLSKFLGTKEYMFGDEEPTEIDCVLFGFLCVILYCTPKEKVYVQTTLKKHQNLVKFTERIKEKYWPDWNECLYNI